MFQTDFLYGLYYSLYAWTNALIGSLFGGIIVDRYGTHFSTMLFCSLYCIGQVIFALGASISGMGTEAQYIVMVLGRFIFGMGGGAITLVQNTISAQYFRHDRMALAMGFTLTASRIGSVINLNSTARLVTATSISTALWIGACLCVFGASFGLCYIALDKRYRQHCLATGQEVSSVAVKKVSLRDIGRLPAQLWILACIISLYYIGIFAFIAIAKDFFEAKWNGTAVAGGASFRSSIVYLVSMVFTIFVGAFVDSVGNRARIMFATCALSVPVFLLFQFTTLDPIFGMLLLGLTYMFAASSMWPCIPLVVPMDLVGTANGVATSVQMVGIALANMLVGVLQDAGPGVYPGTEPPVKRYDYCMLFFVGCGVVASILGLVMNCVDARSGGALNRKKDQLSGALAASTSSSSTATPAPPCCGGSSGMAPETSNNRD
jgi:MFS family permease